MRVGNKDTSWMPVVNNINAAAQSLDRCRCHAQYVSLKPLYLLVPKLPGCGANRIPELPLSEKHHCNSLPHE